MAAVACLVACGCGDRVLQDGHGGVSVPSVAVADSGLFFQRAGVVMVQVNRCGGVADGGVVAEVFGGLVLEGEADAEFAEAGVAAGLLLEGQRGQLRFGGARCPRAAAASWMTAAW